jgi:hypothetical protein
VFYNLRVSEPIGKLNPVHPPISIHITGVNQIIYLSASKPYIQLPNPFSELQIGHHPLGVLVNIAIYLFQCEPASLDKPFHLGNSIGITRLNHTSSSNPALRPVLSLAPYPNTSINKTSTITINYSRAIRTTSSYCTILLLFQSTCQSQTASELHIFKQFQKGSSIHRPALPICLLPQPLQIFIRKPIG